MTYHKTDFGSMLINISSAYLQYTQILCDKLDVLHYRGYRGSEYQIRKGEGGGDTD